MGRRLYQNPSERLDGDGSEHGRRLQPSGTFCPSYLSSQAKVPIGLQRLALPALEAASSDWERTKPVPIIV